MVCLIMNPQTNQQGKHDMSQSIVTKYLGPTNSRGARIKATIASGAKSYTMPYQYELNSEDNHTAAARELAQRLEWRGDYISGHTATGMVFVQQFEPAFTLPNRVKLQGFGDRCDAVAARW